MPDAEGPRLPADAPAGPIRLGCRRAHLPGHRQSNSGEKTLKPIPRPYDTIGSTRYVDFDTTRPVYPTDPAKCHISHVVADTGTWEQKLAQVLEEMPEVVRYVKNHGLGFTIPYTLNGDERQYIPDFIVLHRRRPRPDDLLNLIVEVTGEKKKDKAAKVATARTLWVPAVNNHGGFGRWAFSRSPIRGMPTPFSHITDPITFSALRFASTLRLGQRLARSTIEPRRALPHQRVLQCGGRLLRGRYPDLQYCSALRRYPAWTRSNRC